MSRAELEKRILRLHKDGTGILKIGKALGVGTGTVQRIVMEQPRPFDVGVAEPAAPFPHDTTAASQQIASRFDHLVGTSCAGWQFRFAKALGQQLATRSKSRVGSAWGHRNVISEDALRYRDVINEEAIGKAEVGYRPLTSFQARHFRANFPNRERGTF
jgi:hypothetical protein